MNAYKMYMMTPNDQMSQDLSYFSGPRTSGAKIRTILDNLSIYFLSYCSSNKSLLRHKNTYQHSKVYNKVFEVFPCSKFL